MSHTTTVKTVAITDVDALKKMAVELKANGVECELVEKAKPGMYFRGQEVECDYVLRLPKALAGTEGGRKAYDIGFRKQKDDSYAMIFDEHAGAVASQLGVRMREPGLTNEDRSKRCIAKLVQGYAKHAAINKAKKAGYTVAKSTVDADGNVHLRLRV